MEINCLECSVPSDAKIANAEEWAEEIGQQPIPVPANEMGTIFKKNRKATNLELAQRLQD
jgi:hypothetical protein